MAPLLFLVSPHPHPLSLPKNLLHLFSCLQFEPWDQCKAESSAPQTTKPFLWKLLVLLLTQSTNVGLGRRRSTKLMTHWTNFKLGIMFSLKRVGPLVRPRPSLLYLYHRGTSPRLRRKRIRNLGFRLNLCRRVRVRAFFCTVQFLFVCLLVSVMFSW